MRALSDVRPEAVEAFLASLDAEKTGATQRNSYLYSAKAFCRWCVRVDRLDADPLARLKAVKGDIRRVRRALTEDELARLLKAARERPFLEACTIRSGPRKGERTEGLRRHEVCHRLKRLGWERALIYKTLVLTGLRKGELAALEVRHLTLDGPRPCLRLPGSETKNGKEADIPLRADLVADIRAWLASTGREGADRVFKVSRDLRRALRHDMEWAGIAYRDDRGRTIDVHALRHTTQTYLARGKVAPRVAQGFMRHADIRLTMQTYTDPRLLDEAEALAALPELPLEPADGG
jgi:integrase